MAAVRSRIKVRRTEPTPPGIKAQRRQFIRKAGIFRTIKTVRRRLEQARGKPVTRRKVAQALKRIRRTPQGRKALTRIQQREEVKLLR